MTIHISSKEKAMVEKILDGLKYVYFGSRVKGTHQPYSDLDVCILDHGFSLSKLAGIKHAFSESDLPFKVDVVIFEDTSKGFQELILREGVRE